MPCAAPVTYDVVSLLKDCYIAWPRRAGRRLAARSTASGCCAPASTLGAERREFMRWFDLMGLQRHIKVLGIFARLYYRDGKPGYLEDLPRVLAYTREAAALYPETAEFARLHRRAHRSAVRGGPGTARAPAAPSVSGREP